MGLGLRLRQLFRPAGGQVVGELHQYPFRERLSPGAADTNAYMQPVPTMPYMYYMNYWEGNRLPGTGGFTFGPPPHEQWSKYQARYQVAPLQDYGGFANKLGAKDMANLASRWLDAWRNLSAD